MIWLANLKEKEMMLHEQKSLQQDLNGDAKENH